MRVLSADVVKPVGNHVVYVFPHAVEKTEFVNNTLWAAFTTCAIVRQQCDHRIFGQIVLIQKVEQATNLSVRVIEHRRKSFLQSARKQFFVGSQFNPWAHARVARRKYGVGRDNAHLNLSLKPNIAMHIPTFIKLASPLCQITIGCMVRRMLCTKCEIQKKRTIWSH